VLQIEFVLLAQRNRWKLVKSRSSLRLVDRNGSTAVGVACGARHMLVLRRDGSLWASGDNSALQLALPPSIGGTSTLQPLNFFWGLAISSFACTSILVPLLI
jgi:alpha-tubulin suppressor-like RCC1 family protein